MDVLKISVIIVMAWLLASCRDSESVGGVDNTSPTGDVMFKFQILRSKDTGGNEALYSLLTGGDSDLDVRIYLFCSHTSGDDDSFVCVSPYSDGNREPYIHVNIEDLNSSLSIGTDSDFSDNKSYSYNSSLDINTANGFYYRFLAIGVRNIDRDVVAIDCAPGMKWTDVRVRDRREKSTGRAIEVYSGLAVADKATGSTDFMINGGSLQVDIDMRRCMAGVMLCVEKIPEELISDFTYLRSSGEIPSDSEEVITESVSYSVDRLSIIAPGFNTALHPGLSHITDDYCSGIAELVTIDLQDSDLNADDKVFSNGSMIFPVRLDDKSIEINGLTLDRSSLSLVVYTSVLTPGEEKDVAESGKTYYPLKVIPIRLSAEAEVETTGTAQNGWDDGQVSSDRFRFNLQANHLYCLGTPDAPIDLSRIIKSEHADIEVNGNYQVDVNIPF